jgi:hypothetical protein
MHQGELPSAAAIAGKQGDFKDPAHAVLNDLYLALEDRCADCGSRAKPRTVDPRVNLPEVAPSYRAKSRLTLSHSIPGP